MSVDLELDKLSITLTDHMNRLTEQLAKANDTIGQTCNETRDTIDGAVSYVKKIGEACAKLKALTGGLTNGAPLGPLPT